MLAPNPANRLHCQHSPSPLARIRASSALGQPSGGQFWTPISASDEWILFSLGTARSRRTRSISRDRSSIGLSTDSRASVSCFGFAVGTTGPLLQATRAVPVLGHPLRDPNWLLGGGFCRSRCWLGYHYRIGNRLRNIDGFRAGLMGTNHARPP